MEIVAVDGDGYMFLDGSVRITGRNLACLQVNVERAFADKPNKIAEVRKVFNEYKNK